MFLLLHVTNKLNNDLGIYLIACKMLQQNSVPFYIHPVHDVNMEQNGFINGDEFIESTDLEGHTFFFICQVGEVWELLDAVESLRCRDVLFQYDAYGRQATHAVAETDQANAKDKIEVLVTAGADLNARELLGGNTLLHLAAGSRNYSLAEWICRYPGADLGAINFLHETAYHVACKVEDFWMKELLRVNGAVCDEPAEDNEILDLTLR